MDRLRIALRSIVKSKSELLISILGLGIGLGCVMLLLMLAIQENSFDRFIPNHHRAYRVLLGDNCATPYPLGPSIKNDIPGVKDFFRYYQIFEVSIHEEPDQTVQESNFAFADPSIFKKLGIKMKYGLPAQADFEMAISESMALKFFNNSNIAGELLSMKLDEDFINIRISGVFEDFPFNSTLSPNFIASVDFSKLVLGASKKILGDYSHELKDYRSWNTNFYTYLFLEPGKDVKSITQQMQVYTAFLDQEKWGGKNLSLQAVADIYFRSNNLSGNEFSKTGNVNELKYYLGIAIIILCIAAINYIFITRAKIISRLNEMGTKKALGATRGTIRKQVMFESNITAILAMVPAAIVVASGISFINISLGKELGTGVLSMWQTWMALFSIILVTGSLSGFFIGGSVSRVSPVLLLSGLTSRKRKKHAWENSFLSFHFAVFIVLIVSLLIFKKQINYSLSEFKNINPENVLICELNTPDLQKQFSVIKNELSKNPDVLNVSGSTLIPPTNWFLPVRLKHEEEEIVFDGLIMGQGMIELLEMQMIEGESFGEYQKGVLIINESTANKYGVKAGDLLNGIYVKGIVKDFMAHTLHEPIKPMVILQQHPDKMRLMAVKTTGNNHEQINADIQVLLSKASPGAIANVKLLKEEIKQFYARERNHAKLIGAFSVLAIILAIMGLLGILLITLSKRTKEIGIRKVNGARISEVLVMLNKDFVKWVAIAFVIATPIAYYAMHKWLENFAYKTELSWWIFALAGLLALGIALLTVSWQSWRAATRNPVEALRYE